MRTARLFCIALLMASAGEALAMPLANGVPFVAFQAALRTETAEDVAHQLGTPSVDPARVEEARRYLLHRYGHLRIKRSVVLDGQVFDCVRYDQQPGRHDARLVTAPHQMAEPGDAMATTATQVQVCDSATFPLQRITLVDVMRSGSLRNFFSKDGIGGGSANIPPHPKCCESFGCRGQRVLWFGN